MPCLPLRVGGGLGDRAVGTQPAFRFPCPSSGPRVSDSAGSAAHSGLRFPASPQTRYNAAPVPSGVLDVGLRRDAWLMEGSVVVVREVVPESVLEFEDELLLPKINSIAYWNVYVLESWLRRICLSAWMGTFGRGWIEEVDPQLRKALQLRLDRNRSRLYLGAELDDDPIWQATHTELLRLITAPSVVDPIRALTGTEPEFIGRKLNEVREIRNLLAHNRALSHRTHVIFAGLLASLEECVDTFKGTILYGRSEILDDDADSGDEYFRSIASGRPFQAYRARLDRFIEYVCLPVEPFDRYPDARKLLLTYRTALPEIVAFFLNKTGGEYIVLTPSRLEDERHREISEIFCRNPDIWTREPFEQQDSRYVCSPKVWFYENRAAQRAIRRRLSSGMHGSRGDGDGFEMNGSRACITQARTVKISDSHEEEAGDLTRIARTRWRARQHPSPRGDWVQE